MGTQLAEEAARRDRWEGPLTVYAGPAGSGRTERLHRIRDAARAAGTPTAEVRLIPATAGRAHHLLSRLAAALGPSEPGAGAVGCGGRGGLPAVDELAERIAARPGLVVLVDDAHWTDPQSAVALERLVRLLAGTPARIVCAARTPDMYWLTTATHVVARLRADGLATVRAAGPARAGRHAGAPANPPLTAPNEANPARLPQSAVTATNRNAANPAAVTATAVGPAVTATPVGPAGSVTAVGQAGGRRVRRLTRSRTVAGVVLAGGQDRT